MKTYIGTKLVKMKPMNRADYNTYRGWTLPADENGADEGYLVEYLDGGKPNHPDHEGYISWSPKAQAEAAYRETSGMTFGLAVEALKKGLKVARAGWNGKGMWLQYVAASAWDVAPGTLDTFSCNPSTANLLPWIGMKTADNKFVPWLASQTDVLAEDWAVV
jgi:hypothetical protein